MRGRAYGGGMRSFPDGDSLGVCRCVRVRLFVASLGNYAERLAVMAARSIALIRVE